MGTKKESKKMDISSKELSEAFGLGNLSKKVDKHKDKNIERGLYYESKKYETRNNSIALPPKFSGLKTNLAWANIVVEALNENIRLRNFDTPQGIEVQDIFDDNQLDIESSLVHRDALICGTSYAVISNGDISEGEPEIVISAESPLNCYGEINPRTRQLKNFIKIVNTESGITGFYADKVYSLSFTAKGDPLGGYFDFQVEDINEHKLGMVPAVRFVNRPRGSNRDGASEITQSIKSMIDEAQSAFTEAGVARQLYAVPSRYILGVDVEAYANTSAMTSYLDKFMAVGSEEGENGALKTPTVGQFDASDPSTFIKMQNAYAVQVCAEKGLPESYLGIQSNQPSSADAIRLSYARLSRRAEDAANGFAHGWKQVMKIATKLKTGSIPENFREVKPVWESFEIKTPAASADAATKIAYAGLFENGSREALRLAGLSETSITNIIAERSSKAPVSVLEALENIKLKAAENPVVQEFVEANETKGELESNG